MTGLNRDMRQWGGDKWLGKLAVPASCDPAVRELFELVNRQRVNLCEVASRAGLRPGSVSDWRYRRSPNLVNIRAALNVLGYDLKVVRRRQRKNSGDNFVPDNRVNRV